MDDRRHEPFSSATLALNVPEVEGRTIAILTDRDDLPDLWHSLPNITIIKKETLGELTSAVTQCRLEILRTIQERSPQSLYELAKMLGKNQAYIYRESKSLVELGLLVFKKEEGEGRRKTKPIVSYDALLFWF